MRLAIGTIEHGLAETDLLSKISKQSGLQLERVLDTQPKTQTTTANKAIYRSLASNEMYVLKQRPVYLGASDREFTNCVLHWCEDASHTKMFPRISYSSSNDHHFELNGEQYVLMEFITGSHNWTELNSLAALGARLADLHALLKTFPRSNSGGNILASVNDFANAVNANCNECEQMVSTVLEVAESLSTDSSSRRQVVHGDISPSNVMLTENGNVVFLDHDNMGYGSRYYDLASCCLTFSQVQYVSGKSNLNEWQTDLPDFERLNAILMSYKQSEPDWDFSSRDFSSYYKLCWLEHLLLGVMRRDFSSDYANEIYLKTAQIDSQIQQVLDSVHV